MDWSVIMARRQSMAEDIIDITSRLPWWVGVLLAAISYLGLHSLTTKGLSNGHDISTAVQGGLLYAFATFGQYVLPALFGMGAIASLFAVAKRKKLHGEISNGNKNIAEVSWQDFELLIGEHFRRQGFAVQETPAGSDGGIDLVLAKKGATFLVQCKHYKAYKVGVKPVRELLGVMASSGAAGGYVVTSGEFTRDAVRFAAANNIELMDGNALSKIRRSTPKPAQRKQSTSSPPPVQPTQKVKSDLIAINQSLSSDIAQVCPKCGSPMVVRVARKGSRAGQKFWGCKGYPNCRFTKPFD